MKRIVLLFLILMMVVPLAPVRAQEPPPAEYRLEGLSMLWQQYNRCSPTALYMQLSYFGLQGNATDIVRWLNPYTEDMSVRLIELIRYAETQGLQGLERTGGTIELMQRVVAAGFPILVENAYWHRNDDNDWMSHNRIMMGYDGGSFYFYDPLLGPGDDHRGYGIRYEEFDRRWKDFNRNYMILYRPEDEARLIEVLGEHWSTSFNALATLEQAQADYDATGDALAAYNVGSALLQLDRADEAAQWIDTAREIGLPWRMHWYRFEAFEVYHANGRYDDMLELVYEVLPNSTAIQEVYFYAALAYEGKGDVERAIANYYAALDRNANYPEAQAAIDRLGG